MDGRLLASMVPVSAGRRGAKPLRDFKIPQDFATHAIEVCESLRTKVFLENSNVWSTATDLRFLRSKKRAKKLVKSEKVVNRRIVNPQVVNPQGVNPQEVKSKELKSKELSHRCGKRS